MPRNELPAFDRTRIIALWQEGLSRHQIANRLIVRSTVSRAIRRYEETGEVNSRPRTGRPTVSTRREDRYIAQLARRERSVTVPVLRSQFQRTFNRVISTATIRRRVLASGLRGRRPLRVPLLTSRHGTARLQWARAHQDWLLPQWRNVLFSDESRFGLVSDRGGKQMFLGNIINATVQTLRSEIGDQFIFMDDNARPHRTRAVQQALENGNIGRLEWPAMSSDMNPIEHVWDYVSRAIFNGNNPPRSTQELIVAATEECDNIPQKVINNLIFGMHRRVDALIRSRGRNANPIILEGCTAGTCICCDATIYLITKQAASRHI
nr:unnamed protein product [Callosobruchus chinensis]